MLLYLLPLTPTAIILFQFITTVGALRFTAIVIIAIEAKQRDLLQLVKVIKRRVLLFVVAAAATAVKANQKATVVIEVAIAKVSQIVIIAAARVGQKEILIELWLL